MEIKKFKEISVGLFRNLNGLVYVKLASPTDEYNAVSVIGGEFIKIEDEAEIITW